MVPVSGNTREAKRILTEMDHASGYVDPHDLALVNAGLGDKKRAFEWLEKGTWSVPIGSRGLGLIEMDPLRSDTRFRDRAPHRARFVRASSGVRLWSAHVAAIGSGATS